MQMTYDLAQLEKETDKIKVRVSLGSFNHGHVQLPTSYRCRHST